VELALVIIVVVTALAFDYINGFHDAANSIATVVSTRVLSPGQAVLWAAFFNFAAAAIFGTAVARTVGSGMIDIKFVTSSVILAGLLGAIVWDLITGITGCLRALARPDRRLCRRGDREGGPVALIPSGWTKTLIFIVLAPLIGFALGFVFMVLIFWIMRPFAPSRVDRYFRKLQLVSAALYSLGHGANDAQKTMGIIAGALFAAGYIHEFTIPFWVEMAAYSAISLARCPAAGASSTRWDRRSPGCSRLAGLPQKPRAPCLSSPRRRSAYRSARRTPSPARSSAWDRRVDCQQCDGALRVRSSGHGSSPFPPLQ
jgi:PiT family inorganic phosphate transporter